MPSGTWEVGGRQGCGKRRAMMPRHAPLDPPHTACLCTLGFAGFWHTAQVPSVPHEQPRLSAPSSSSAAAPAWLSALPGGCQAAMAAPRITCTPAQRSVQQSRSTQQSQRRHTTSMQVKAAAVAVAAAAAAAAAPVTATAPVAAAARAAALAMAQAAPAPARQAAHSLRSTNARPPSLQP